MAAAHQVTSYVQSFHHSALIDWLFVQEAAIFKATLKAVYYVKIHLSLQPDLKWPVCQIEIVAVGVRCFSLTGNSKF